MESVILGGLALIQLFKILKHPDSHVEGERKTSSYGCMKAQAQGQSVSSEADWLSPLLLEDQVFVKEEA